MFFRISCFLRSPPYQTLLDVEPLNGAGVVAAKSRIACIALLHVLMLSDFERADRIGEFWGYPESRAFAELLIDCEEDRTLRAVFVGMLREMLATSLYP